MLAQFAIQHSALAKYSKSPRVQETCIGCLPEIAQPRGTGFLCPCLNAIHSWHDFWMEGSPAEHLLNLTEKDIVKDTKIRNTSYASPGSNQFGVTDKGRTIGWPPIPMEELKIQTHLKEGVA